MDTTIEACGNLMDNPQYLQFRILCLEFKHAEFMKFLMGRKLQKKCNFQIIQFSQIITQILSTSRNPSSKPKKLQFWMKTKKRTIRVPQTTIEQIVIVWTFESSIWVENLKLNITNKYRLIMLVLRISCSMKGYKISFEFTHKTRVAAE